MANATPIAEAAPPTERSPAHTPMVPPAGVQEDGDGAVPSATPPTEEVPLPPEPFADELPPDFWGDALEPPDTPQAAPEPETATDVRQSSSAQNTSPTQNTSRALEGKLEADPRFILLTELFPGRISDWQSAEPPPGAAAEGTDDALEAPETVDLEAGLDLDDTGNDTDDTA